MTSRHLRHRSMKCCRCCSSCCRKRCNQSENQGQDDPSKNDASPHASSFVSRIRHIDRRHDRPLNASIERFAAVLQAEYRGYSPVWRRSGGTGRRAGLKIRWGASPVWVRFPPSASMKVGVRSTGGGDCPGLNAVIRAVARRSLDARPRGGRHPRGLARARRRASSRSAPREISGLLPRGGTILGTSRTNPYKLEGGVDAVLATLRARTASTRSSRSAARTRSASRRGSTRSTASRSSACRRRSTTTSPATDYTFGFDTAVFDRDRGDRPAAHDGRVAQPRDGRRGDGPPHRLDRRHERDRRRRRRDPDPRAAGLDRGRAATEIQRRHARGKDFSIVVVSEGYELTTSRARRRPRGEVDAVRARPLSERGVGAALAARDRAAHGLRDARHGARPRPARRHPDPARPRARDPLRAEGRRPRPRGKLRPDGRAAGDAIVDVSLEEATAELKTVPRGLVRRGARASSADAQSGARAQRERAVPPRRDEEVLPVRGVQHRVEALAAVRRARDGRRVPSGRTPSIASRLRWKSSLVGLKTTKWTPADGPHAVAPSGALQKNGLSSVLKSARCGIAVPFAVDAFRPADDVVRSQARGRLDRGAVADPPDAAEVALDVARRVALASAPAARSACPPRTCRPGRNDGVDALAGSRSSGTRPRGPRGCARGACACRRGSSRRRQVDVAERLEVRDPAAGRAPPSASR